MFGQVVERYDEIDSTSRRAIEWAQEGAPEGAVVVASHQTAGRGRWGRTWLSRPGSGLLFSLVLRRPLDPPGLLTSALGVGVARGIQDATDLPAVVKWPNDVEIEARKVAGILVEAVTGGDDPVVIAGVGINLDWKGQIPAEIQARATSIVEQQRAVGSDLSPPPEEIFRAVLDSIEQALAMGPAVMIEARARSSVLGRHVVCRLASGELVEGEATALLNDGTLRLMTESGTADIHAGEVEQLRPH